MYQEYGIILLDGAQQTNSRKDEIFMNKLKNRNYNGELVTYQQIAELSNLGLNTVMRLARESGALVKIGRISRVNQKIFFEYVTSVYQVVE